MKYHKICMITGAILAYGETEKTYKPCRVDEFIIAVAEKIDAKKYFYDFDLMDFALKPEMPVTVDKAEITADGVEVSVITLPTECPNETDIEVLLIFDGHYRIGSGKLEFSTLEAGTHKLIFKATNYLEKTVEVTANAPAAS